MVIRPTLAPLRSTRVLVATVLPWIIMSADAKNSSKDSPWAVAASFRPTINPSEGSLGVEAVLK